MIWGRLNDEDDCTRGELDGNTIAPFLEEEKDDGNETRVDFSSSSSSGMQDEENSNSTTPVKFSAPETATLLQNQNYNMILHRPDIITVRGSIRGGPKSSSLASPSKKSKSEIIFGVNDHHPPNEYPNHTKNLRPSSQSKIAIVFGERRRSTNHGNANTKRISSNKDTPPPASIGGTNGQTNVCQVRGRRKPKRYPS